MKALKQLKVLTIKPAVTLTFTHRIHLDWQI